LTLAYSETHPDRCTALIMRGIFLLRKSELAFFYQDGTSRKQSVEGRTLTTKTFGQSTGASAVAE
jgi:hypothetical protein